MSLIAVALACGGHARASEPRVALTVERTQGAERCPDAAGLRAKVVGELGRDPFDEGGAERLAVRFARVPGGGFTATIARAAALGSGGERALDDRGPGCARLAARVALALVVAIEALPVALPDLRRGLDDDAHRVRAEVEPTPPAREVVRPRTTHAVDVVAVAGGAELGLGWGGAILASGLARAGVEWRMRPWCLGLEVVGGAGRLALAAGDVAVGRVELRLAPALAWKALTVGPLVALGAVTFSGSGFTRAGTDVRPWLAFGLRAGVALPLNPTLVLRLTTDVTWPLLGRWLAVSGATAWTWTTALGVGLALVATL
ncbi:MAG: hypothetical protein U1F43_25370 [Myxococcota bacterium]